MLLLSMRVIIRISKIRFSKIRQHQRERINKSLTLERKSIKLLFKDIRYQKSFHFQSYIHHGQEMLYDALNDISEENPMNMMDQALANAQHLVEESVCNEAEQEATEEKKVKIVEKNTGKHKIKNASTL